MRWQLEALSGGTRLTLWTNIGHRFIAMGAAGWHICFDVLDHLLSGTPIGRIVGPEAMKFPGAGSGCTRSTPGSSGLKRLTCHLRRLKSRESTGRKNNVPQKNAPTT